MKKAIIVVLSIAVVVCAVLGFVFGKVSSSSKDDKTVTTEEALTSITLDEILEPASELVSLKYCYTDADIYEKNKEWKGMTVPFTTDKVVFTYSGTISAGIDISEVKYEIINDAKRIIVTLPEAKVLSHEMDEKGFKFYDVKKSVFTQTSLDDYTALMAELKEAKEKKLKEDGEFFKEVEENAQSVLENFLTVSEATKDYTVTFK
ncbi:DUF4230 domain-containing protein [Ruminococcus sp. XPD3002]|uniref:DUF4230 domain-containing protein n=1 Tax=Ruminococcus sp. XPD3002 TaxID=1452269 RepID=UPI000911BA47|nr:Protein of unknown function [Ruminococcus flavefaciens]